MKTICYFAPEQICRILEPVNSNDASYDQLVSAVRDALALVDDVYDELGIIPLFKQKID